MRIALAAALTALLLTAAPAAAQTPEQLLSQLAAHQTHGWTDVVNGSVNYPAMEATIAAGGRVYVPCGVISILAKRLLDRNGIPNRLVGTFSNTPGGLYDVPAGTLESHAMIEVWEAGRWVLYDLDGNVKAVDTNGQGVGLREFAQSPRHYLSLANDELYSLAGSPAPVYETWVFANHEAWYDRVLGTLTVLPAGAPAYYFTDPALKDTLDPMPGYQWVNDVTWQNIVRAAPTVTVKPAAHVVAPVAAPAVVVAPARAVAVPHRSCRKLKRRYHRLRTHRAHRRYVRCLHANRR